MREFHFVCIALGFLASQAAAQFVPGHIYTPTDDGRIIGWTQDLEMVGEIQIEGVQGVDGVQTATGAVFNSRGNLVFIGRRFDSVRVIEVDGFGSIVNEFDSKAGALTRGKQIDYHAASNRYIFADDDRITLLDSKLNFISSSTPDFEVPTGVAFSPDGSIWGIDNRETNIRRFNDDLSIELDPQLITLSSGGGMSRSLDGEILVTDAGNQNVRLVDPFTGDIQLIVSGLGTVRAVTSLADKSFLTTNGTSAFRRFDLDGNLLAEASSLPDSVWGMAQFIPSPSVASLVPLASVFALRRRRRLD